jgi:hypothetical protein
MLQLSAPKNLDSPHMRYVATGSMSNCIQRYNVTGYSAS